MSIFLASRKNLLIVLISKNDTYNDSQLEIFMENVGTQSLYSSNPGEMEIFSVSCTAEKSIIIERTGTVTGFITLQTSADATASCTQT